MFKLASKKVEVFAKFRDSKDWLIGYEVKGIARHQFLNEVRKERIYVRGTDVYIKDLTQEIKFKNIVDKFQ